MKKKFSVVYNAGAGANRVLGNSFEYTVLERSILTEYESTDQQAEEDSLLFDPSYMKQQLAPELATDPGQWTVNIQKLKSKLGIVEHTSKFDDVVEGYGTLAKNLAMGAARSVGSALSGAGKRVATKAQSYIPQNTLPAGSSKIKQAVHNTKRYGAGVKNAYDDAMNKITPVAKGMSKVSDLMGGDPRSGTTSNLTGGRKESPTGSALADAIASFQKNPNLLMSNPQFIQWSRSATPQEKKAFVDIMAQLTHPSNNT